MPNQIEPARRAFRAFNVVMATLLLTVVAASGLLAQTPLPPTAVQNGQTNEAALAINLLDNALKCPTEPVTSREDDGMYEDHSLITESYAGDTAMLKVTGKSNTQIISHHSRYLDLTTLIPMEGTFSYSAVYKDLSGAQQSGKTVTIQCKGNSNCVTHLETDQYKNIPGNALAVCAGCDKNPLNCGKGCGGEPFTTTNNTGSLDLTFCDDKEAENAKVAILALIHLSNAGVAQSASLSRSPFTMYDNLDLNSRDMNRLSGVDASGCASACTSNSQCQAYSFDKWNRACYLKSEIIGSLRLDPHSVTGVRQGLRKPATASDPIKTVIKRSDAFPGNGYRTLVGSSFELCESACQQDTSCVAFTFKKREQTCQLFSTTGEYFSDSTADSGFRWQEP